MAGVFYYLTEKGEYFSEISMPVNNDRDKVLRAFRFTTSYDGSMSAQEISDRAELSIARTRRALKELMRIGHARKHQAG